MSKNGKLILGVAIIIAAILLIVSNRKGGDNGGAMNNARDINVGVILPLTGDAAAYGEPALKIFNIAVQEINDAGGVNGRKLKLVVQDGMCGAAGAVNAANKLIDVEKVKVIIGGFCSSESLAVVPLAEKAKVAMYNPGSSSPALTGKSKFFMRNYPSDAAQGQGLWNYAARAGKKNVGVLVEQTDYALGVSRVFEAAAQAGGATVTHEEFAKDGTDFRSQLTKLRAANVDALLISVQTPASGERVVKQLKDLGWKPSLLLSDAFVSDTAILENNKDILEGAVFMTFGGDVTNAKAASMISKYKVTNNGAEPAFVDSYALTEYDIVYMLADALKAVGEDGEKVASYAQSFKDWDGASGKVTIGADGDRQNASFVTKMIMGGKASVMQ
ncbi:MAG TPA: ABC transporter substrate-binding protein [Patescibacteria group bacterium]|nr:ABC transporter substrate-binding protein [Patescibacteria group bacterium]